MRQNCCASLAKKWEIAGIKAVQLSCVYGVPIISDSGRKDSVTLGCTTKTQQRCWSSCVHNSHTVWAVTAICSHLTVTNAHTQGQKIMNMDYDCRKDHSKLKLIDDRKVTGALLEGCNAILWRNYIIRHFVNESKMLPRALLWDFSRDMLQTASVWGDIFVQSYQDRY